MKKACSTGGHVWQSSRLELDLQRVSSAEKDRRIDRQKEERVKLEPKFGRHKTTVILWRNIFHLVWEDPVPGKTHDAVFGHDGARKTITHDAVFGHDGAKKTITT